MWGICLTPVIALASALLGGPPRPPAAPRVRLLAGRPGGRPRARAPAPHRATERGLPESSGYPTDLFLLAAWAPASRSAAATRSARSFFHCVIGGNLEE